MSGADRRLRSGGKPKADGPPRTDRKHDPSVAAGILIDECDSEDADLSFAIQSVIENLLIDSIFVTKLVDCIKAIHKLMLHLRGPGLCFVYSLPSMILLIDCCILPNKLN